MIYIYAGKNNPGTSMHLVAEQVRDAFPEAKIIYNLTEVRGDDFVINIVFEDTEKILETRRYVGRYGYACLLAGHPGAENDYAILHQLLYYQKHPMVTHSSRMRSYLQSIAGAYLQPSITRKIMGNVKTVIYGLEDGFEPGPYSKDMAYRWIVPANRMGMTDKNLTLHGKVSQKVSTAQLARDKANPLQHLMYLSKAGRKPLDHPDFKRTEFPEIYMLLDQPDTREEYKANARKAGGFLCTALDESFGIYYLELLLSGCVGVFLDREWIRALLPGYPLLAKGEKELEAMMLHVVQNHKSWREYILKETVPFIKDRYQLSRFKKEFAGTIDRLIKEVSE